MKENMFMKLGNLQLEQRFRFASDSANQLREQIPDAPVDFDAVFEVRDIAHHGLQCRQVGTNNKYGFHQSDQYDVVPVADRL